MWAEVDVLDPPTHLTDTGQHLAMDLLHHFQRDRAMRHCRLVGTHYQAVPRLGEPGNRFA